jgi:hypothetical protein
MTIMEAAPLIKERVTSRQIVEHYGYKPDRGGYICCPFHGEKTPSLKVHKSGWYCYGCHEGGDVIEFVRLYERCRFAQAVAKVDMFFNLGLVKAEKVSLADLYAARQTEQTKRKADHALRASKTAFSARLDKDWAECWEAYRAAHSTPAGLRTALLWWNMAIAEDMLEYIDYFQELTAAASDQATLSDLMARYEKGVNRNADGGILGLAKKTNVQADHRDVPVSAGGHVRRDDPAEQAVQQAGTACRWQMGAVG